MRQTKEKSAIQRREFQQTQRIIRSINKKQSTGQTSAKEISAEMKRLVSEGKDLSVETLARQANKIANKEKIAQDNSKEVDLEENEVLISLR